MVDPGGKKPPVKINFSFAQTPLIGFNPIGQGLPKTRISGVILKCHRPEFTRAVKTHLDFVIIKRIP